MCQKIVLSQYRKYGLTLSLEFQCFYINLYKEINMEMVDK